MALRIERQRAVVDTLFEVEKALVPFVGEPPIVYPDAEIWQELTKRRKEKYESMDLSMPGAAEQKISKALSEPTELQFIETPLQDVVNFIKDQHDIEVQLDTRSLDAVGLTSDTPVTVNLKGLRFVRPCG